MFRRQTSGSVVCVSCGYLVGVNDEKCYNCGRRNPGLWGFAPVVRQLGHDLGFSQLVMGSCIVLYVVSWLMSGAQFAPGGLFDLMPVDSVVLFRFGASGSIPVYGAGRWWTMLSAAWLHANLLHIVFNLWWIRQIAPEVADFYGPGRTVIIYTVAAITGFFASSTAGEYLRFIPISFLQGASLTIGASGSILGLLGALVYYGRRTGSRVIHSQAMGYVVYVIVIGFMMQGVDNYAHLGGFAGGYLTAKFLDPLKPERIDHVLIALGCIALSAISIIVSFVTAAGYFQ